MQTYVAKSLLVLPSGSVVGLNAKQAADRKGRLIEIENGRFRLKEDLHFKAKEQFDLEGEMSKPLAGLVERVQKKRK